MGYRPNRRDFLLTSSAFVAAALGACGSAPEPASTSSVPAHPTASGFPLIADTAQRLDVTRARALRAHGVKTVFRYYSHLPPSLPDKDLQPEEAKIILGEGLSIGSAFQHYNNCFRTFENNWGREDAEQALRMAEAAGQPEGSAIYFGVDADWPYAAMRDPIVRYFEDVKRAFEGSGIAVGVYSNGCICNAIRERGLAQYFWLSGSTGHSGTQAFYNSGRWTLFQNALDIRPSQVGYAVDTDIANPATQGYFGQWNDRGARQTVHPAAEVQQIFEARAFLRANTDIKAVADTASETLINLRKDQNVRRAVAVNGWAQVVTQEGGARTGAQSVTGWIPVSALAPMARFPDNSSNYGVCGAATPVGETFKYQNCERAVSRVR
jgi:hypothetical protein